MTRVTSPFAPAAKRPRPYLMSPVAVRAAEVRAGRGPAPPLEYYMGHHLD